MTKHTIIWIIAATSLVLLGAIIFAAAMVTTNWDFTKLGTEKYETNTYEFSEEFTNIAVDADTANILFAASDDGVCKVVCYEPKNAKHSVSVQDGELSIHVVDLRKWYEHIGIFVTTPKITVYLPEAEYASLCIKESTGDIEIPEGFTFDSMDISLSTGNVRNYASASETMKIKTSTGDIHIEKVSASTVDVSVTTGKVTASDITCSGDVTIKVTTGKASLSDITCQNLFSTGSTGDISMKNVVAGGNMSIDRSTGDVAFESCDAAEIFIRTETGNVTGSLLSEKIFIAESNIGKVNVPKTVTGGRCEIISSTGSIKITVN